MDDDEVVRDLNHSNCSHVGFKCCRLNRGLDCSPRLHVAMLVLLHGSIVFITLQLGLYTYTYILYTS